MSVHQWTDGIAQNLTEALLLREADLDVLELSGGLSSTAVELVSQLEVKRKNCSHSFSVIHIMHEITSSISILQVRLTYPATTLETSVQSR
jgi:hypothetical protein